MPALPLDGLLGLGPWGALACALLLTHLTIVSVTVYLHRGVAHRAVDFHPALAKAFRIWLWLSTGMTARQWAAVHRKHHAKCETAEDPHSPVIHGIWTVLLKGVALYRAEATNPATLERYGRGAPDDRLEAFLVRHSLAGIVAMLAADLLLFGALGLMVWAIQMLWIPFWAAGVINGVGHFWGYRNFQSADQSRNIFPWGIVIGGEELHNNHHAFPASAKLSARPYELDIGWGWIRALELLGLARAKRSNLAPELGARREQADEGALAVLLANRMHAFADLRRSLAPFLRERFGAARLSGRFSRFESWFFSDPAASVPPELAERFELACALDPLLARARAAALALRGLWEAAHESRDELLARLSHWIAEAEASGIEALRRFGGSLLSYHPRPA